MRLGVNGRFYGARTTGVQRFAREIAARLCAESVLLLPGGVAASGLPAGARIVRGTLPGHAWEQFELPLRAGRAGCNVVLHLAGTAPVTARGDVVVVHDVLPLTHPEWFARGFRGWRRFVLRRAAARAARVVTVSSWAAEEVSRTLRVPRERVLVARQGLAPFDRPAPPAVIARVRERYGLEGAFLLAVGAGDPRKNLPFLGHVLRRWRNRGTQPPVLVVAGEAKRSLFAAEDNWPVGVDARHLGRVDDADLHGLYTAAAALCFPSLEEGFGRPPLEALACGTPAVVAPYAAAREVLNAAARVVPLDPERWVDVLRPLVDSPPPRLPRRDPQFDWDAAAAVVRAACEEAAAERGR